MAKEEVSGTIRFGEGELSTLNQLMKTVEDSYVKLKKAFDDDDPQEFNKLKAILIKSQRRITELVQ